jgi:ribosomal protein S18 acetylase RimI-like enzyme
MPETHTQGLLKKQTLSEAEISAIAQLINYCNTYEELHMRLNLDDLETIAIILATDSGNVESVRQWIRKCLEEPDWRFYMATLDGKPLGCLRLDDMGNQVGIYAFEVRLGFRGLGYGRQILEEAIRIIRAENPKPIMLDVETDNVNALGLYQSCGFEINTTYDYYGLEISTRESQTCIG